MRNKALSRRIGNVIANFLDRNMGIANIWPEAELNNYAVFMSYLSMAVKGLGYLVLTWTSVVLLGGFVSMLLPKDFWSLTVITLVQTAGVLDVSMNERLSKIGYSFFGLYVSMFSPKWKWSIETFKDKYLVLAVLLIMVVQALVFVLILCPLVAAFKFRLLITTAMSLWCIIQRDFVKVEDQDKDDHKNLTPALNVLYSLALLQGGLFFYMAIFSSTGKTIASSVVTKYKFNDEAQARLSVMDYFRETRVGLEKDPSFARGRKLLTYAMQLLESKSPDKYLSGARILDTLLQPLEQSRLDAIPQLRERRILVKQLLLGPSSAGNQVQKLLWILDLAEPYGGEEARELAARIVENLADELNLEEYPRGLRRIGSLLEQPNLKLTLHGLRILEKLAADDDNCRAMSDVRSLFPKIMDTVSPDRHQSNGGKDHDMWSNVARTSLSLLLLLMGSPGESGAKLRYQGNEAISATAMESILMCDKCADDLQEKAMQLLQDRPGDEARRNFIASMLHIFARGKKNNIRDWASKELNRLSEMNPSIILQANGDAPAALTEVILDARNNDETRHTAAIILVKLCRRCHTMADEHLKKLRKSMMTNDSMPKILGEILTIKTKLEAADIEAGYNPREQSHDTELMAFLVRLCFHCLHYLAIADKDLPRQLDEIVAKICLDEGKPVKSLETLMKEVYKLVEEKDPLIVGTLKFINLS
ncbi:hypothetical protein QOZ80_8AG0629940 [Eleusine coracana subsp. coracana]|nr:hypothetical protein QOZ80_8AG0629940 [Eleusine coracana subsp. coracana]